MNPLGKISLSAALGIIAGAIPVYLFMVGQIERRVLTETRIAAAEARNAAQDEEIKRLEGRVWTAEQDIQGNHEKFIVYTATHP